jgi:hypothetical protein
MKLGKRFYLTAFIIHTFITLTLLIGLLVTDFCGVDKKGETDIIIEVIIVENISDTTYNKEVIDY